MNYRILNTPQVEGTIWGLIVVIMLLASGVPPVFALVVGIIIGVVAGFILDTNNFRP
jgi:ABC-type uncharacterized transport system permease subunit